ncbi:hypothetical protein AMTR_s00114p00131350 [Amborella trichopoda]|uniref:Uncharacterized protein n=1 Tax=Amborella trichopoda TaxID=13333 RepID=W1NPW0_AMBTC|nr:hypothetical protein AMTR_s00114p00131350 [Amborella trichopoda]
MESPNFPRLLEIRLNPQLTSVITGSEEHSINIPPPTAAQGESSRKCSTTLKSMSISFEDEEDVPKAASEVVMMKDPKS